MTYKIKIYEKDNAAIKKIDRCLIAVSLANPSQRGEKLRAAIKWANEQFEDVVIDIGDTLTRHNFNEQNGNALEQARAAGDIWLEENKPFINGTKIIRWEEYTSKETFQKELKSSFHRYQNDLIFKSLIDADMRTIAERRPDLSFQAKLNFLLEEYTVDKTSTNKPTIIAYAGKSLKLYEAIPHIKVIQYRLKRKPQPLRI